MASGNAEPNGQQPRLEPLEALRAIASDDENRDHLSLGKKEQEILELYDRIQEQQLEEELLLQDPVDDVASVDDVKAELAKAERELLDARATCSIQRKAIESVLMTDPTSRSVFCYGPISPIEKALFPLINRRDSLSFVYETLARLNTTIVTDTSNIEVKNIQANKENQDLVRSLLDLTEGRDAEPEVDDPDLKQKFETLKRNNKLKKDEYRVLKRILSASIVASGVDWASDATLLNVVLEDGSDDEIDDIS